MSETHNTISLYPISAPSLNQVTYAESLNDVFSNIDHNFSILSNPEFTKGEKGESIEIVEMPFFNGTALNDLGNKLVSCIQSISNDSTEYSNIEYYVDGTKHVLSLFDNFYSNPGTLKMIRTIATDSNESEPISSLYYVFLDGRYANTEIGTIDESYYSSTRDFSCILVYDKDVNGFRVLSNAFPTIYYDPGYGLCWKINGVGTGIPVKGQPGKNGFDARLHIVKCNSIVNNEAGYIRGIVNKVYGMYDGYTTLTENDMDQYENKSAVIVIDAGEASGFYFGYLSVGNITNQETGASTKVLYANCDQETAINAGASVQTIINAFKHINLFGVEGDISTPLRGIFVPISNSENGIQPVHLLTSTSITNTEGDTTGSVRNDLILTPINDINSLEVSDDVENKSLKVDKYLYLKVNTNSDIFNDVNEPLIDADMLESKYGCVLKYKLTSKISSVDTIGNVYDMHFGHHPEVNGLSSGILTSNNVIYYSTLLDEAELSNITLTKDHKNTLPLQFARRLTGLTGIVESNGLGIYSWELCNTKHSFDVNSLSNSTETVYNFPSVFNTIYTTTINPSIDSEILWFNGMEIISGDDYDIEDNYNTDGYVETHPNEELSGKFVVPGWTLCTDRLFSYIKFIPVYDNDFSLNEDTALNLNYNINVTGDESNPTRNITIHGSVNCDNLSVHKLTASEEIKDIYTKDVIKGDAGIKLAKISDEYKFEVNSEGTVTAKDLMSETISSSDSIIADKIYARHFNMNEIRLNNEDDERQVFIGNVGNNENYTFGVEINDSDKIDINNIHNIYINRNTEEKSVCSTDLPLLSNNNATIMVSNQSADSEYLCYVDVADDDTTVEEVNSSLIKSFNESKLSNSSNAFTKNNKYVLGESTKIYTDNTNLMNDSSKIISVSKDGWSENISVDTTIGSSIIMTESFAKNHAIQSYTIQRSNDNELLNSTNPIEINFSSTISYVFGINLYCQRRLGTLWPYMHSDSVMNLILYYTITDDENKTSAMECLDGKAYKFDYSTSSDKDENGYFWGGYDW